jgi:hypothetical protein
VPGVPIRTINVCIIVGIVIWRGNYMPRVNSKVLLIGVIDIPLTDPTLVRFQEKGHQVYDMASHGVLPGTDVIIGPRCWRIDPKLRLGVDVSDEESLERQLEMAEKGLRAIKYPKEKKDDQTQNTTR